MIPNRIKKAPTKPHSVSSRHPKTARNIQTRPICKYPTCRIHQIQIRIAPRQSDQPLNHTRIPPDHPPHHILNLGIAEKVGDFVGAESKFLKRVEKIRPGGASQFGE